MDLGSKTLNFQVMVFGEKKKKIIYIKREEREKIVLKKKKSGGSKGRVRQAIFNLSKFNSTKWSIVDRNKNKVASVYNNLLLIDRTEQ